MIGTGAVSSLENAVPFILGGCYLLMMGILWNFPIRLRSVSWQWHCFFPDFFLMFYVVKCAQLVDPPAIHYIHDAVRIH